MAPIGRDPSSAPPAPFLVRDLLAVWFAKTDDGGAPVSRPLWFKQDDEFDRLLADRFGSACIRARKSELDHWQDTPEGALALILLLDQLPRNLYRDTADAFAADAHARRVADAAIARGFDRDVTPVERWFFYLPFEHSEDIADQERSVALFRALGPDHAYVLGFAEQHRALIARFGRFPHRNAILGRASTPEEETFLNEWDGF